MYTKGSVLPNQRQKMSAFQVYKGKLHNKNANQKTAGKVKKHKIKQKHRAAGKQRKNFEVTDNLVYGSNTKTRKKVISQETSQFSQDQLAVKKSADKLQTADNTEKRSSEERKAGKRNKTVSRQSSDKSGSRQVTPFFEHSVSKLKVQRKKHSARKEKENSEDTDKLDHGSNTDTKKQKISQDAQFLQVVTRSVVKLQTPDKKQEKDVEKGKAKKKKKTDEKQSAHKLGSRQITPFFEHSVSKLKIQKKKLLERKRKKNSEDADNLDNRSNTDIKKRKILQDSEVLRVVTRSVDELQTADKKWEQDFEKKKATKNKTNGKQSVHKLSSRKIAPFSDDSESNYEAVPEEMKVNCTLTEKSKLKELEESGMVFFPVSNGALLLLIHPQEICFQGRISLSVLSGSVDIMGYSISQYNKPYRVFSPRNGSLITLKTTDSEEKMSLIMKTVKKLTNMEPLDDLEECIDKTCVLLRLEKLESATCEYLSSFHAYSDIFHLKTTEDLPCSEVLKHFGVSVSHISAAEFPVVTVSKEYENILKMWTKLVAREETVPVVLVCGGKGLGKSTFNRILLNQTLNQVDMVYYLDCDVGQSEFTPAGCVSLQKVTEPVLGPPFCHQQISESTYFFGAVSPADNPSCYLQYLARAFSDYRKLTNPAPLVINTMGWIEGLGHELLIDTIAITSPTLVVQLRSNIRHQNLPNLTPVYISNKPGWMSYMEKKIDIEVNEGKGHKCVVVNSAAATQVQQGRSYKLSAREQRELTLLGYLSADLDHGITLASCAPKIVTWNSVAIHICHTAVPTSQVLYAINASVVALCHADLRKAWQPNSESPWFFESMPVCQCLGFGFVRAINPETKQLYIVTPLTIESLSRVNALLKGALTLPDISLLKQRSVFQENEPLPPYVDQLVHSRVPFVLHPRKRMWRKIHTTYRSSSDLNTDAEHS